MSDNLPARFKSALQKTEQERQAGTVAELFSSDAKLTNLGGDHDKSARDFWQAYLEQFDQIRSEFTHETVAEKSAALEWRSRGKTKDGREVDYRGISVIEFDGDKINRFRTYYDSAAFVRGTAG